MNKQAEPDRKHPFLASIQERYPLSLPGSLKETLHVVLNVEGSGIQYRVGDSIAIYPQNDPALVERTLAALKATGSELVEKKGERLSFAEFLSSRANLKGIARKFLHSLAERVTGKGAEFLQKLMDEENKEAFKEWAHSHEMWDLLQAFPDAFFSPQEFADLLMPLLPRFYSIASAQSVVGDQVHLTVAYLRYETREIIRLGVCTHYLCQLAPMHKRVVPVYHQPSLHFQLPSDGDTSIIMVGPGTGVAPYRGFMQEREQANARGKNWLFFGEWTRAKEFFYQEEWEKWKSEGLLKLDVAFSRDQTEKIYVQHKMIEAGRELYSWLEEGAVLYVCGDAHRMAKDVDLALHQIIEKELGQGEAAARDYIKRLKAEKRYLRDVY